MAGDQNIPESQLSLFTTRGLHSCLWPEATTFNKLQIPPTADTDGHIIMYTVRDILCNIAFTAVHAGARAYMNALQPSQLRVLAIDRF